MYFYLFANRPTVETIACKPTSPQLVAVSCGARERPTLLFIVSLHRTLKRYVVLTSHSSVLEVLLHI